MHHLKAVGLAMLAAFALSAVAASGAVANEETPKPNPEIGFAPTEGEEVGLETITAGPQTFQMTGVESFFRCTNSNFISHEDFKASVSVNPLTIIPDFEDPEVAKDCYSESAFGQFNLSVHENGCDIEFFAQTHNEQTGNFEGDAYLDCTTAPEGNKYITTTIPAIGCAYHVPTGTLAPYENEHPITYTNVEHEGVEAVTVEIKGEIPYTHTGGFCPGAAEGEAVFTRDLLVGGIDTDTDETVDIGVTTTE